jgi:ankyrin repeat protein
LIRDLAARGARLPDDVLMGPVQDGDVEIVRLLVRRGANVNCVAAFTRYSYKFPQKQVLLTVAIENISTLEIAERTAHKVRAARTVRWRAAHPPGPPNGDLESIPVMLIKAGADVNRLAFEYSLYEGFIRTTLGLAAHCGLVRTTKAMLAAGADVNQRDTWDGTALFDAAHEGHRDIARILLAAGARTDIKRRDGATPISTARERGFTDLADQIEKYKQGA